MKKDEHHIFDLRDCLSKEELSGYAAGTLSEKEKNSVERHLLDCELCSEALEGVLPMTGYSTIGSVPGALQKKGSTGRVNEIGRYWRSRPMAVAAVLSIFLLSMVYLAFFYRAGGPSGLASQEVKGKDTNRREFPAVSHESPGSGLEETEMSVRHEAPPAVEPAARPTVEKNEISETLRTASRQPAPPANDESISDIGFAEEVVAADADEPAGIHAEAKAETMTSMTTRLTDYYGYKTERQKDAVYIGKYKISPEYVLTDVESSPMNSNVALRNDAVKAKKSAGKESAAAKSASAVDSPKLEISYNQNLQATFAGLDSGNTQYALASIEQFAVAFPGDINGIYYRALVHFTIGNDQEAMAGFQQVVNKRNKTFSDDALWHQALLNARNGNTVAALRILRELIEKDSAYREPAASLTTLLDDN